MTKAQYLKSLKTLYRAANMADSEHKDAWMKAAMAGNAGCAGFDKIVKSMLDCGAITQADFDDFYADL